MDNIRPMICLSLLSAKLYDLKRSWQINIFCVLFGYGGVYRGLERFNQKLVFLHTHDTVQWSSLQNCTLLRGRFRFSRFRHKHDYILYKIELPVIFSAHKIRLGLTSFRSLQ